MYSDNHEKFVLVLDGQEQYRFTKDDVKLTGLNKQVYKGEIIFQDGSLPIIVAEIRVTTPSGAVADAYYNIRRKLDGSVELHCLSFVPINDKYLSNDIRYRERSPGYGGQYMDPTAPLLIKRFIKTTSHNGKYPRINPANTSFVPTIEKAGEILNYKKLSAGAGGSATQITTAQLTIDDAFYVQYINVLENAEKERNTSPVHIDLAALGSRKRVTQDVHNDYIDIQNSSLTIEQLDGLARVRADGNGQSANMRAVGMTEEAYYHKPLHHATDGSLTIKTITHPSVTVTKTHEEAGIVTISTVTTYVRPIITSTIINEHPSLATGDVKAMAGTSQGYNKDVQHHKIINKIVRMVCSKNDNETPAPATPVSGIDTSIDNGQMVISIPATISGTRIAAQASNNREVITTTQTTLANTIITPGIVKDR